MYVNIYIYIYTNCITINAISTAITIVTSIVIITSSHMMSISI